MLLRFQFIRLSISAWRLKVLLFKKACNLKILYPKEFGFRKDHSTVYALLQLVDQIYHSFEPKEFTIGVFIHLSKTFDTVDHSMRLKK